MADKKKGARIAPMKNNKIVEKIVKIFDEILIRLIAILAILAVAKLLGNIDITTLM